MILLREAAALASRGQGDEGVALLVHCWDPAAGLGEVAGGSHPLARAVRGRVRRGRRWP
jgi:hypothetical protein